VGASNAWIITQAGVLVIRPADGGALRGVTPGDAAAPRAGRCCAWRRTWGWRWRSGRSAALKRWRREAFVNAAIVNAATTLVAPVVRIDGAPGQLTLELRRRLHRVAEMTP